MRSSQIAPVTWSISYLLRDPRGISTMISTSITSSLLVRSHRCRGAVSPLAPERLATAVFTHGHTDHCFGVEHYEERARAQGWRAPRVLAHEAITARFDRYRETAGYNGIINQRQFQLAAPTFPTEFRYPDETFR